MATRPTWRGNEVSEHAAKNGFVDLRTLAEGFNLINVSNCIFEVDPDFMDDVRCGSMWEDEDGETYEKCPTDKDVEQREFVQFFLVDESGFQDLQMAGEVVCYSSVLGHYVWCVGFFGMPWNLVLTKIPLRHGGND